MIDIENDIYSLTIPNKEVRKIYENKFSEWFEEYSDSKKNIFVDALLYKETKKAQRILNEILMNSISYYDTKENFYYGLLVGLMQVDGYTLKSNRESGNGRYDILLQPRLDKDDPGVLLELKFSNSDRNMERKAKEGLKQIKDNDYLKEITMDGYNNIIPYGISFYKKSCFIIDEC